MNDETFSGVLVSQSASATPMGESGIVARMIKGRLNESKVASSTTKTSSTANPSTPANSRNDDSCASAAPPISMR